jgi:hypothetical protein
MSVLEIVFSARFLAALSIYGILIAVILPYLDRIHDRLEHPVLQWKWDHIAMPLLQVVLLLLFILMAYPVIFGIPEAPPLSALLARDELRINYLVNLLFVVSLFFPLIPVAGNWHELILPLQGIAASMMIFSWLAASLGVARYNFWPGWYVVLFCLAFGVISRWLAAYIAMMVGNKLDKAFNVLDSGELFSRGLILLMQSPVILAFSSGLGKQL